MKSLVRAVNPHKVACLALAAAALGVSAGCSLIGLGIGAGIDSGHKVPERVQGWELERIKPGKPVRVVLRRGADVSGVYGGMDSSPDEYAARYAVAREQLLPDLVLPMIGDPVVVTSASGVLQGAFVGFEPTSLQLQPEGQPATGLPLAKVVGLSMPAGQNIRGERLTDLVSAGKIPLRSRLIIDRTRVPLEEVDHIEVPRGKSHGKLVGFLVGAAVDAIVIVIAVSSLNHSFDNICKEPTPCTSCPLIYSFDGERYRLDAEVFGGAIFKAAQRPDWATLDHLAETDGEYRIRLTNEQPEIQYADEVKLWVVDHPDGGRVVPSLNGRLYSLSSALPPARATDLRGQDVLPLVRARDDEAWVSNPFGRDPEDPADTRDGLVLEFPRPLDARSVTLAFNVRSTPWASHLLGRMLSLQGTDLAAWSARMNTDAGARTAYLAALRREGLLTLRVWNGGAWQEAGFLANLGPVAFRDQAVRLEIGRIPGDVLRVRLDSTPGLWIVNSAEADYGRDSRQELTELSPITARTHRGEDIRGSLEATDGRYYVMNPGLDSADLVFRAPPRSGWQRSLFLKSAGYYTILVPAEGTPQSALFAKLVNEPGAFGRYSLGLLHSDLRGALARLDDRSLAPAHP